MNPDARMTLTELRAALVKLDRLPDGTIVVLAKDAEGNGHAPLAEVEHAMYCAGAMWSGEHYMTGAARQVQDDPDEYSEAPGDAVNAVSIHPAPTNPAARRGCPACPVPPTITPRHQFGEPHTLRGIMADTHTLSDGTTIRVRVSKGLIGTEYREMPSRNLRAGAMLRIDRRMYVIAGPNNDLVPVQHPDYEYATTDTEGARKALAFFVEAAESCIKHAQEEGIPVERCYGD